MERYKTECEDLRSRLATLQTSNETMEKELIRARVASPASSPARSGNRSGNTSGVTSAASTPHRTPRSSQSASAGASLSATPERRKETAKETAGTASGPTHAHIAEISTALDAARTDASDKERRLGELSEKLRALEVSSASALAAADSSKKTIEDLTAALTEANARVNAEKQRAARLGTELATKEAERAALTAELASKPSNSAPRAATEGLKLKGLKLSLSKSTSFGPGFAPRRPRWREPGTTRAEPTSRSSVTNPKRTHLPRPPRPRTPRKPSPCAENSPHSPPRIPAPRKKSQSSRKKYVSATQSSYNKRQSPMHGSRNSQRSSTDRGPTRNVSRRR